MICFLGEVIQMAYRFGKVMEMRPQGQVKQIEESLGEVMQMGLWGEVIEIEEGRLSQIYTPRADLSYYHSPVKRSVQTPHFKN